MNDGPVPITDPVELARRRADYMRHVASKVDRHGWIVQGVFPRAGDAGVPFAYTVGLTRYSAPELAIAGLGMEASDSILNDLASRFFDTNRRYSHGEVIDDVLSQGFNVTIVDGVAEHDTIWPGMARALYGPELVRLQQVVWPDQHNRFPWDPGYSIPPDVQPTIGRPS